MRCREWQRSHVLPDIRLRRSQPARARPRRDSGRTRDHGECDPEPTAVALVIEVSGSSLDDVRDMIHRSHGNGRAQVVQGGTETETQLVLTEPRNYLRPCFLPLQQAAFHRRSIGKALSA
jgi:hypothetical protein